MTIESFAHFYVFTLQPVLKGVVIAIVVIFLLQVLNFFSGKDKRFPTIDKLFNSIIKLSVGLVVGATRFALWFSKKLLTYIKVIFDTFKDFFTSQI